MFKELISILNDLLNNEKQNNKSAYNFENDLINLIKSMVNVKSVSIRFLEYGVNIYLNGYSIGTIYHNKNYDITKVVFYKYDLYYNTNRDYTNLIEVLNNLKFLDINRIKSLIQKKYLNPKKYKK